jgi:SAM-dependent methyltransferase
MGEWDGYILESYEFSFAPGSRVVDIGCGEGLQLTKLASEGQRAVGVDVNLSSALPAIRSQIVQARAEALPFCDACADAALIKVVLPYTDDRRTLAEIARILKPGGTCILVGHGLGYYVRYVICPPEWRTIIYGLRTIANSALFFVVGKRLPGFWGDSILQTPGRLRRLYNANRLSLREETPSRKFLGFPVFIYHRVSRD